MQWPICAHQQAATCTQITKTMHQRLLSHSGRTQAAASLMRLANLRYAQDPLSMRELFFEFCFRLILCAVVLLHCLFDPLWQECQVYERLRMVAATWHLRDARAIEVVIAVPHIAPNSRICNQSRVFVMSSYVNELVLCLRLSLSFAGLVGTQLCTYIDRWADRKRNIRLADMS